MMAQRCLIMEKLGNKFIFRSSLLLYLAQEQLCWLTPMQNMKPISTKKLGVAKELAWSSSAGKPSLFPCYHPSFQDSLKVFRTQVVHPRAEQWAECWDQGWDRVTSKYSAHRDPKSTATEESCWYNSINAASKMKELTWQLKISQTTQRILW